jgi:methyl-accepting chemotaxis protein
MSFFNKNLSLKVKNLENELAEFKRIQEDLKEEMNYFSLDMQANITEANQHFLSACGYTETDMLNKNLTEFLVKKSMNKSHGINMLAAIKAGKHWHGAIQIISKTGNELWFRSIIQPITSDQDNKTRIVVYSSELTNTIENSREQQDMVQALNRSSAVIEFSLQGIILNANQNFLDGMHYAKNQIIGKHHSMFCSPEEVKSETYKNFWARLNKGEFISNRFQRFDSHGTPVWLEASYNPIHDESGVLYKVVKFATVITEQMTR